MDTVARVFKRSSPLDQLSPGSVTFPFNGMRRSEGLLSVFEDGRWYAQEGGWIMSPSDPSLELPEDPILNLKMQRGQWRATTRSGKVFKLPQDSVTEVGLGGVPIFVVEMPTLHRYRTRRVDLTLLCCLGFSKDGQLGAIYNVDPSAFLAIENKFAQRCWMLVTDKKEHNSLTPEPQPTMPGYSPVLEEEDFVVVEKKESRLLSEGEFVLNHLSPRLSKTTLDLLLEDNEMMKKVGEMRKAEEIKAFMSESMRQIERQAGPNSTKVIRETVYESENEELDYDRKMPAEVVFVEEKEELVEVVPGELSKRPKVKKQLFSEREYRPSEVTKANSDEKERDAASAARDLRNAQDSKKKVVTPLLVNRTGMPRWNIPEVHESN